MNHINQLLRTATRRIVLTQMLSAAHLVAVIVASIALVLMIADRLPAASFVPWIWVGPSLGIVFIAATLIVTYLRRPTPMHVAMVVDERLDLNERLSTALSVRSTNDPFAQAAFEDGVTVASDPKVRERAKRAFAIQPPNGWWVSPLIAFAALAVSMLQPMNLFERDEQVGQEVIQAKNKADEVVAEVIKAIEKDEQLSKELSDGAGDLSDDGTDPDAMRSPKQVKRNALKKVYELNKRLEEILKGEKGKTNEALKKAMRDLDTPNDGPAKEFAEALNRGDFTAAKKALEQLLKKAESGELNAEQLQQAKAQLEQLAKQLEELAKQHEQLKEALKRAGMDPQLANNPQALQQAIENNKNLNEQQKQQLKQMAKAQQQAQQMCQGLGGASKRVAQAMGQMAQGQPGQMGQAGRMAQQQLSEMENLQQLLQQARAAQQMCEGSGQGLGQGLAMQQALQQWKIGQGMNQGQGAGKRPVAPTPSGTKAQKANVNNQQGDIIARTLIEGEPYVGESRKDVEQVAAKLAEGRETALNEQQIPRKYHDVMKKFFGDLEAQVKSRMNQSPAGSEAAQGGSSSDGAGAGGSSESDNGDG